MCCIGSEGGSESFPGADEVAAPPLQPHSSRHSTRSIEDLLFSSVVDPHFLSVRIWIRIQIQIQGFDDQKLEEKNKQLKIVSIFFVSKMAIYLSLGLH
jgi:hypothetical protein